MSLNNLIFYDNLPKLDIHGIDRDAASLYIGEFIEENYILNQKYFIIIHGIGTGVLKQTTKEVLKRHKKVVDFKTLYHNQGTTIVEIKGKKDV